MISTKLVEIIVRATDLGGYSLSFADKHLSRTQDEKLDISE
jgi:hypothetical protein